MTDRTYTVLLYSDDPKVRDRMRLAVGTRPAADLQVEFVEADDYDACVRLVDDYEIDLMLLDGEATPAGGVGLARQIKDDRPNASPPVCLVHRPGRRPLAGRLRAGRGHPDVPARPDRDRPHRRDHAALVRLRRAGNHRLTEGRDPS